MRCLSTLTILTAAMALAASVKDPARGRDAFDKRCTGCHALDKIKIGPPLRGIYGRSAGKNPQFAYSEAVKAAPIVWDEATLDRWLTDTDSVIPDNDMAFRLNDPADRASIIAYLRQVSGK
ncbi:MAG: c-type cytochrome [Acidobacteriota bacterium]|nr:c-type cytochrome [Acidobacteriota bacterium]